MPCHAVSACADSPLRQRSSAQVRRRVLNSDCVIVTPQPASVCQAFSQWPGVALLLAARSELPSVCRAAAGCRREQARIGPC
jgi:hypothetical protein